ncbi:MAG: 23S rRNA (adenine(2030)-N(6))-methyltransferase RlmJ [Methylobacillus sp.]|jgi:23S rRNA (adenine2030-N6)-methyltransferase|nr:23S rRNA (adenine(2030)-N(6))-methyltransferase RlmJ [Methylobacillus sp.]
MLSYRHAFHAGNHADVLKHAVLTFMLDYYNQKDKPYWFIDTHAGAGCYQLGTGFAAKNAEHETGIDKLQMRDDLPEMLRRYVTLAREDEQRYPGSPLIAWKLMRPQDKLRLFELHPTDVSLLRDMFEHGRRRVQIEQTDGFAGLKALLPPSTRRAIILIDPPYEVKDDYRHVITALKGALQRFATGTYALWYPKLQRPEIHMMLENLKKLAREDWLNVALDVHAPNLDGYGMYGSGLFILNPPWTLHEELQTVMPWLTRTLGNEDATYTLESGSS